MKTEKQAHVRAGVQWAGWSLERGIERHYERPLVAAAVFAIRCELYPGCPSNICLVLDDVAA
jgi:hypothetical protein